MMPPKKRTDQPKRVPSTSPTTSTSYPLTDQQHRLRHTGPSISTRSGVGATKPPVTHAYQEPTHTSSPTQRGPHEKKPLKDVEAELSPPGARTSLIKLMYVLLFTVLLLLGWYAYGMITLLEGLKEEVGWWGIIVRKPSWSTSTPGSETWRSGSVRSGSQEKGGDVQDALNVLADALGIPALEVASAVKPLIPKASLTNVASEVRETSAGGGEAMKVLLENSPHKRHASG